MSFLKIEWLESQSHARFGRRRGADRVGRSRRDIHVWSCRRTHPLSTLRVCSRRPFLPSPAVVERVKPAVVSVKVKSRTFRPSPTTFPARWTICRRRCASSSSVSVTERRLSEQPGTAARHRPGVRLLHFRRRLYRHQQPCRGERQVRHHHHGQRQDLGRQSDRHGPENGSGAAEGR